MTRALTPAEKQLLSKLADGRLLNSEIDPELLGDLKRDGYVRQMVSTWRVTPAGALALMETPR